MRTVQKTTPDPAVATVVASLSERRRERVIEAVRHLLPTLGIDPEDDANFCDTPRRFADYLIEHFLDTPTFEETLEHLSTAVFPTTYQGMVTLKDVHTYSICPHHLLAIEYTMHLAYIPEEYAIGLSKLARIAELCAKRAVLQENLTEDLADALSAALGTRDVAVIVIGAHACMRIRGVEQDTAVTTTSSMRGRFLSNEKGSKEEFMRIIGL